MLEPKIVAARIHWNRPPARCEILGKIDKFISELHPHDAHPRAKNAFQMFVLLSENFDVRDFLKRERRIERHRAVHVAHRHADRFDRDLWGLRGTSDTEQREQRSNRKFNAPLSSHSELWSLGTVPCSLARVRAARQSGN